MGLLKMLRRLFYFLFYLSLICERNSKIYLVKTKDMNNTQKDNSTSDLTSKETIRKMKSRGNDYEEEIAGGEEAEGHEFPWMVQLRGGCTGTGFCGGSLISDQLVLTAYHCTHRRGKSEPCDHSDEKKLAIMGQPNRTDNSTRVAIPVIEVIYPEHDQAGFDKNTSNTEDHDFAMYLLKTPV